MAAVTLAAALGSATAEAATRADRGELRFRVGGGPRVVREICGARHRLTRIEQGQRAIAHARSRPGTLRITLRSCAAGGRAARVGTTRTRRLRTALPVRAAGDYAVRAELRRGGRRVATRTRYLRVRSRVVELPVSFRVANVNRSNVTCPSDGGEYTIAGRLVAPRAALGGDGAVTLLLHEFSFGRWFWRFPGHDFARRLAEDGHATVAIDRLGYDDSDHPEGTATCIGAHADMAHQITEQLRAGSYQGAPAPFARVALGGHSGGGAIAEQAIHSFGGIDALILFAYADNDFTPSSIQEANEQGLACAMGGEEAEPGEPGGYAYLGQTPEEWKGFMFTTAPPDVADAAAALRNRDPCGDSGSFTPAVISNNQHASEIEVPVLLLYGTRDAIYEQPAAGEGQRDLLSGSSDVTLRFFEGAGHALTLERSAPEMRAVVADWLAARGF